MKKDCRNIVAAEYGLDSKMSAESIADKVANLLNPVVDVRRGSNMPFTDGPDDLNVS